MILHRLNLTTSRLVKEVELKSATSLDKKMFRYAYDKSITFGVKFTLTDSADIFDPTDSDFILLDRLARRDLTGQAARDTVEQYCATSGSLIKLICNKDLDCGVSATTINKVLKGVVPQFKLQLAKALPLAKIQFPVYAETKYDGVRVAVLVNEAGQIVFKTRNGLEVNLPNTAKLLATSKVKNVMLDCEVTLETGRVEDRTKVSGMINSALKGGVINESLLIFNVFDTMPLSDFEQASHQRPYYQRRVFTASLIAQLSTGRFTTAKYSMCCNIAEVNAAYEEHIANGFEGLILKHADSLYTFKRTTAWAKMKEVLTADLICTGIVEGTGKYEGMIGALVCEGLVNNTTIRVRAGSGLTDLDRAKSTDHYVGKVVELKYNTVVRDKTTGEHSLFLPRFVMVRHDR